MLWTKWSGVTPQDLQHEGATVDARMKAESGEMRCVGTVHDAALRGAYSFTPDAGFAKRMETMGFDDQTPERLEGYAMLDVTTAWVKEMKDAGVTEMTAKKLMGLKALKVDAAYVKAMAAAGYPELRANQLTSMKAVGVSPEKVQAVRAISERRSEESVPILIKIARTHPNQAVRKQAIRSLGESGDPRAVDFFKEVLMK